MGQRIRGFYFVTRDPPQVGFESRVMGDYPARFGEHFNSALVNGSPLSSKKEAALPTAESALTLFIIMVNQSRKGKGQWWPFGKVGPIGCLLSSDGTEEEQNKVRAQGAAKRVESIRLDDREKQNEISIWPKKKQRYGYLDRSPSIKKNLSKSLRISGAFKHPKYTGLVNEIALLNDDSFRKTKLFKFFFSKKSKKSPSDSPTSHPLKRTLPAVRPSLNYLVMQYLLKTKNQMHFEPVVVLNHFVESGVLEPSTMGGANAQGISLDKRIRNGIDREIHRPRWDRIIDKGNRDDDRDHTEKQKNSIKSVYQSDFSIAQWKWIFKKKNKKKAKNKQIQVQGGKGKVKSQAK
ncbi:hypothetical protein Tco_1398955 [Tanacetum coccineum]